MNPLLAEIYGTGLDKTASEDDLDLNNISAADFLEAVEAGEIDFGDDEIEKEAGDEGDLDLSQISAAQLLDILEEDEGDDGDEGVIEKMASDGSLDYWDTAGRIMAHAYADQMDKVAGEDEDELYALDDISAEDLLEMVESGEFEIVDGEDFEKEAGARHQAGLAAAILAQRAASMPGRAGRSVKAHYGRRSRKAGWAAQAKQDDKFWARRAAGKKVQNKDKMTRRTLAAAYGREFAPEGAASAAVLGGGGYAGRRAYVRRKKGKK
jgi:hypothetical protein